MTADVPRRFSPLRPAPRRTLTAVAVLGPLLWIVALLILDVALRKWDAVQIGLLVALGSFVVALLYLVPQRLLRVRRERAGAPCAPSC